jgi:superfamily II DNA or RNA helicase
MELLPFQVAHAEHLVSVLRTQWAALDASDVGTGKTYVACALARRLRCGLLVVAPKAVLPAWHAVATATRTRVVGVANYELLKGGKWFPVSPLEPAVPCPLLTIDESTKAFRFEIPPRTLVVIDEAHRAKNVKTSTWALVHALFTGVRATSARLMLLSATLADKVDFFRPFGYVLGQYADPSHFKSWLRALPTSTVLHEEGDEAREFLCGGSADADAVVKIHRAIFPACASRIRVKDLGDAFPANQVTALPYALDTHEEVDALYAEINRLLRHLTRRERRSEALGRIILCLQRIEVLKVPIFVELAEDALASGCSVVIFTKFRVSQDLLADMLRAKARICGGQPAEERAAAIAAFQANTVHVILVNIQAGSAGISLHDLHGRQRVSLISPTWAAIDMQQALGRIHRAGARSPALQRIVFVAQSMEERICALVNEKLGRLRTLNDGDLTPFAIPVTTAATLGATLTAMTGADTAPSTSES